MKIIKSFRKSITMKVDEAGKLIVKAPLFSSKKVIDEFINKNKNWIDERKTSILNKIKKYNQGDKFMFFGDEYELIYDNQYKKIYFDGMNFYLSKDLQGEADLLFEQFFKEEAKKYITERIKVISEKYDLKFDKLRIGSAKTRWGSCSSKKTITFSYRLIMAPIKTVDYVIVHELAHLKEMNHSRYFWDLVEEMMLGLYPGDYKIHKKWLSDHGDKLIY